MFTLPEGYWEIWQIDLRKNRKTMQEVSIVALLIAVAFFLLGVTIEPIHLVFDSLLSLLRILGMLLAFVVYALGHELVHGFFIRIFSGKGARYGFAGHYAYAGSEAYFTRKQYLVIAFAPVVFFGLLFLLLQIFLPNNWFWVVYLLQIFNLSGAAGDFYVSYHALKMPADLLVQDAGTSMRMYSRTQKKPS